ncbi:hypothetical protein A3841_00825 [Pontibacter flavimaris]|uniref:Uncharacterized protein n=2 Tax=Pontibacter flavimaris TaxID=1797110 RepID=A0A1Q5PBC6_9BACT|nr:hypothetical protein A3841_00825 [Pontibacter flavimaris]
MMEKMTEREKEYLPLLKYVMILSEKGIPTTVESVGNGMMIGSYDAKYEDGKWYISKDDMLKRIRQNTNKKIEPIEAGHYSIHGLLYHLSESGIDFDEGNITNFIITGRLEYKQDNFGRFVIPAHELEKLVKKYSRN